MTVFESSTVLQALDLQFVIVAMLSLSDMGYYLLCYYKFVTPTLISLTLEMSERKAWWTVHSNFAAARDYAYTSRIILKQSDHCVNASVTLKPSLWPRDLFEQITEVQTAFNSVLDAISQDYDFMYQSLERYIN